jgi:hypothetical protein
MPSARPRRARWLPASFFMRPAQAAHRPPHRRLAQPLAPVLRPPGALLQHGRIRLRCQPCPQDGLLPWANPPRAAGDRLGRQRPGLLLPHHVPLDRRHTHPKTPGGFSHGPTLGHHPDHALAQVVRIGSHTRPLRSIRALPIFPQVALRWGAPEPGKRGRVGCGAIRRTQGTVQVIVISRPGAVAARERRPSRMRSRRWRHAAGAQAVGARRTTMRLGCPDRRRAHRGRAGWRASCCCRRVPG